MTQQTKVLEALMPCPFKIGQVWKNPDNEIMMVTCVADAKTQYTVNYVTERAERGSFTNSDNYITDNIEKIADPALQSQAVDLGLPYRGKTFTIETLEDARVIVAAWEIDLYQPDKRLLAAIEILRKSSQGYLHNPKTHILIAREDVPSVDNLHEAVAHMEQYEIVENRMQKWGWYLRYIIDAAALLAQKTEE